MTNLVKPIISTFFVTLLLTSCGNNPKSPPPDNDKAQNRDSSQQLSTNVYDRALQWAETGDVRVLSVCDSLLKLNDPKVGASPYYYLGIFYAERGDTLLALSNFDKTIVADYTFFEAYIEKAALLIALKKPAEAQKELSLLRDIAPTYAPVHYWIAKLAESQQKKELAIYHYKLALSLDSTLVEARQGLLRLEK